MLDDGRVLDDGRGSTSSLSAELGGAAARVEAEPWGLSGVVRVLDDGRCRGSTTEAEPWRGGAGLDSQGVEGLSVVEHHEVEQLGQGAGAGTSRG